jgi:predicted dienelactone hydrolase
MLVACVLAGAERQPVGMLTRSYTDDGRKNWQGTGPRPLTTVVWYPAAPGAKPSTEWGDPEARKLFVQYPLVPEATVSSRPARHPVLLISHGSTGQALGHAWLGTYFASHGYIVAAVNHHGNTSAEKELLAQGFAFMWERARDLSVVLDRLLEDPLFGHHVDAGRIVAAGHSSGGETVIELAGGIFDSKNIRAWCESDPKDTLCSPPPQIGEWLDRLPELAKTDVIVQESMRREGTSFKDRRIKAVLPMAPAVGIAHTKEGLQRIDIPVHIVVGDADVITPPATNARRYAELIPGAKLTVLPGVDHMTFGGECTPLGVEKFGFCRDPAGVDRAAIHRKLEELALDFFERALN